MASMRCLAYAGTHEPGRADDEINRGSVRGDRGVAPHERDEAPSDTTLVSSDTLSIPMCSSSKAGDAYALGNLALDGHDLLVHVQFQGGLRESHVCRVLVR